MTNHLNLISPLNRIYYVLRYREIKNWNFEESKKNKGVTGHFTAIVWGNTTEVNCGIATKSQKSFVVCQYYKPGNVAGGYTDNVHPLSSGRGIFPNNQLSNVAWPQILHYIMSRIMRMQPDLGSTFHDCTNFPCISGDQMQPGVLIMLLMWGVMYLLNAQ